MRYDVLTREQLVEELRKSKGGKESADTLLRELQNNQMELEMENIELRETQELLRSDRDRYCGIYDALPVAVATFDEKGRIRDMNVAAAGLLGVERSRALGMPFSVFLERGSFARFQEHLRAPADGGARGAVVLKAAAKDGKPLEIELLSVPFGNGKKQLVCTTLTDVGKRSAQAGDKSLRASNMESLGRLAGGIAHSFNNVIAGVLGNASLGKSIVKPEDKAHRIFCNLEKAALRARDLTQQLAVFSKGGEPIKNLTELGGLIRDSALQAVGSSGAKCEFSFEDGLWPAEVDRAQIGLVIQNLVHNAVQAMGGTGTVCISAGNLQLAGAMQVSVSVRDTGVGIPPQDQDKVFEPYFSTKPGANGLGLASAYCIIKKHGGRIELDSAPGEGTTVAFYLPASMRRPKRAAYGAEEMVRGSGKVLLMDDEEVVRETAAAILSELGYRAVLANDGAQAIEIYRSARDRGEPFDAVIMDLTVPGGMGGRQAVSEILKIDPHVKVIISSGYCQEASMADLRWEGCSATIPKPYSAPVFSRVLHEVLQKAAKDTSVKKTSQK